MNVLGKTITVRTAITVMLKVFLSEFLPSATWVDMSLSAIMAIASWINLSLSAIRLRTYELIRGWSFAMVTRLTYHPDVDVNMPL